MLPTPGSDRPGSAALAGGEPVRFPPPRMREERCDGCLVCYYFCPHGAVDPGPPVRVVVEWCKGCGICVRECPRQAFQPDTAGPGRGRAAAAGGARGGEGDRWTGAGKCGGRVGLCSR